MRLRSLMLLVVAVAITAVFFVPQVRDRAAANGERPRRSNAVEVEPDGRGATTISKPDAAVSVAPTRIGESSSHDFGGASDSSSDPEDRRVVTIDAIVSVLEADGREHVGESGIARLHRSEQGEGPEDLERPVTNGRFSVDLPRDTAFDVCSILLGGRPVDFDNGWIFRQSDSPVTIHARRARPFRVRVIDAGTGIDLHGITMVQEGEDAYIDSLRAGSIPDDAVLLRDASSPIDLEVKARGTKGIEWEPDVAVTAEGYSWSDLLGSVDFRRGGELVVPLTKCGALEVKVFGAPEGAFLIVRGPPEPLSEEDRNVVEEQGIRILGDEFFAIALGGRESAHLDKIPAGSLVVTVELPAGAAAVALDEVAIDLTPGETKRVTLKCKPLAAPQRVAVSGTIEIAGAWKDEPFTLRLQPKRMLGLPLDAIVELKSSEMELVSEEPRVRRWASNRLLPTAYAATIPELFVHHEFDVGAEGCALVRIVAGECGEVFFEFVDPGGDIVGDVGLIQWKIVGGFNPEWAPVVRGDETYASQELDHRFYHLFAPIGRGAPALFDDGRDSDWTLVDASPVEVHTGTNEFTFHVRHQCGVDLELSCQGSRIAWPSFGNWPVETVDAAGDWVRSSEHIRVAAPGRYRVTLLDLPGFEPVPPFDLDIAGGPYAVHVVELRRKH